MAQKTDPSSPAEPEPSGGAPAPSAENQAIDVSGHEAAPVPSHPGSRRVRLIAAAVIGALVIAGGSAAVTAYALSGATGSGLMGAMPGMQMPGAAPKPVQSPANDAAEIKALKERLEELERKLGKK